MKRMKKLLACALAALLLILPAAMAEESAEQSGVSSGIFWVIGAVVVIAVIYALASTGRLSAIWDKIRRAGSEMTGGAIGKKPDKGERKR